MKCGIFAKIILRSFNNMDAGEQVACMALIFSEVVTSENS